MLQSEEFIRAVLEQVGPPTSLPSRTVDYVIGEIMRARSVFSKLFSSAEEEIDEVFVEILPASRKPRIRQWWVQDARLKALSLDPRKEVATISTLGLTSVSRVDLKLKWLVGTGKLIIRDTYGRKIVIRQMVEFQRSTLVDMDQLAPRVRRFLNLGRILQEHVI